jgi:ABC-type uncharacterized transport system substrate-binding protein
MVKAVLKRTALLLITLLFAGCGILQPAVEPAVEEPQVEVAVEPPAVVPEPTHASPPPPALPAVAIVLTNQQPAYADVARELARQFPEHAIYDLSDASRPPVSVMRQVNDTAPGAVIAIGLRAARSSVSMSRQPVIFSQVFNYRHHDLLQDNSRGVAVLPPLDAQVAAWKDIDPAIARIGMIIGEGHEDLVSEAEIAAERHDVELVAQVTRSDQETLYFFRRMIRDIDAFWLLPDNRVLSARVLEQMIADARRQHVPVSVPSDSMLALGATVSMSSEASDIAARIVGIVRSIQAGKLDSVPPITALLEIRVRTNRAAQVAGR